MIFHRTSGPGTISPRGCLWGPRVAVSPRRNTSISGVPIMCERNAGMRLIAGMPCVECGTMAAVYTVSLK